MFIITVVLLALLGAGLGGLVAARTGREAAPVVASGPARRHDVRATRWMWAGIAIGVALATVLATQEHWGGASSWPHRCSAWSSC
jgi:uncharacterized membrane protein